MRFIVAARPSFRMGKLRLYDVTMVFGASAAGSERRHWPMHGPQALARTVAPMRSSAANWPSRSSVARICSDPGVTISGTVAVSPWAVPWAATSAARDMSSYEELVQLPTRAAEMASTN